jgi:hypothetical protein
MAQDFTFDTQAGSNERYIFKWMCRLIGLRDGTWKFPWEATFQEATPMLFLRRTEMAMGTKAPIGATATSMEEDAWLASTLVVHGRADARQSLSAETCLRHGGRTHVKSARRR